MNDKIFAKQNRTHFKEPKHLKFSFQGSNEQNIIVH